MTPALLKSGKMWHIHTGDCDVSPGDGWYCPYASRKEAMAAIEREGITLSGISRAFAATCQDCGMLIKGHLYWRLPQVVWLHTSGTGHAKFWFWRHLD